MRALPGKVLPPPVGDRPVKAQRIMTAVYEQARKRGYSKARAAKIGWGAVRRAGYDPDHFDYEIAGLLEIIRSLKAKDAYLDAQAERLGTEYQPVSRTAAQLYTGWLGGAKGAAEQAYPLATGAVGGALVPSGAEAGLSEAELAELIPAALDLRRRKSSRLRSIAGRIRSRRGRKARGRDPAKLSNPIDLPGYDNSNMVRLVPQDDTPGYYPTRGLVEGQIIQPQHQFLKVLDVIQNRPEYAHIELTDENGDGYIDRWIARGPKDSKNPTKGNVNIFGDIAKPMKNERLAVENWRLA